MIEVKNAVKKFKKVQALDDINFNIKKGKIIALLGMNGSGKSTIMKAIMGLQKLDSGEILIDGEKLNYKHYDKISLIPDINCYNSFMTIKELFQYMNTLYKNWDMEKAEKMLKDFNLDDLKKISHLSKGNIARVKLIIGFCQNPKYLLMDEPFSGIDIFTREDFIKSMIRLMNDNIGILLTTHEIKEIEHLADEVVLIENGKLISKFNVEELKENQGLSIEDKLREVYKNGDK